MRVCSHYLKSLENKILLKHDLIFFLKKSNNNIFYLKNMNFLLYCMFTDLFKLFKIPTNNLLFVTKVFGCHI